MTNIDHNRTLKEHNAISTETQRRKLAENGLKWSNGEIVRMTFGEKFRSALFSHTDALATVFFVFAVFAAGASLTLLLILITKTFIIR